MPTSPKGGKVSRTRGKAADAKKPTKDAKPAKATKPAKPAKATKLAAPAKSAPDSQEQKRPVGRPQKYQPDFARQANKLCDLGATDSDLADFFGVSISTIWRWKVAHDEFRSAVHVGRCAPDDRVVRSLYQRAVGYSFDAVKIFMPSGAEKPVYAEYREHVPPDPNAIKLWLCNRRPEEWRDKQALEHTGKDGAPLMQPVINVTTAAAPGSA